jgi:hypothetical protein
MDAETRVTTTTTTIMTATTATTTNTTITAGISSTAAFVHGYSETR